MGEPNVYKMGEVDQSNLDKALQSHSVVDLRFIELLSLWQHLSKHPREITLESIHEGIGFDGSSIRGWQAIHESDMLLKPALSTAHTDPFMNPRALVMVVDVYHPITGKPYEKDPRHVARRAEEYLRTTGIGDKANFGPEAEFYIFDGVRFSSDGHESFYRIDSGEGRWETGSSDVGGKPNLGYRPRTKEGYFPAPPMDSLHDLRSEMMVTLEDVGIQTETHHHEVGGAGQAEIGI